MNTNADEYGVKDSASSNGSGKGHKFTDPDTIAVLEARREARRDPRLSRSMKAYFDEVADRALNPAFYDDNVKGVVTISDLVFAKVFRVKKRTIYNWKYGVEVCGYFWLSKKWQTNMWPLTTYHLTCLHKRRREKKTSPDGTYGSSSVHPALPSDLAEKGRRARNAALAEKRAQKQAEKQGLAPKDENAFPSTPAGKPSLQGISAVS